MTTRAALSSLSKIEREPSGAAAVRAAMRYRVALVQAAAGWGKTAAIRAAVGDAAHLWIDLATHPDPLADLHTLPECDDRIVVLDGAHVLEGPARAELFATMRRLSQRRWLVATRSAAGFPIAAWIATGDASAPVDARDLSLTSGEIADAALATGVRADAATGTLLLELTGGWPVAVRFAIAALERSADIPRVKATLRRMLGEYVEDEILRPLPADRREFLIELAMLGMADERLISSLGRLDPGGDLAWLRGSGVPVSETADGIVLHDAFARVIVAQVALEAAKGLALRVAAALRLHGRIAAAFDLIWRYAPDEALAELHADGFALLDAGCADLVDAVIRGLPQATRRDDPIVVSLRAELEAQSGGLSRANDLYERALALAPDPALRALVSRHRAIHYLNQGSAVALDAIAPALGQGSETEQADARGIYAMALALTGSLDDARREASAALSSAGALDDDRLLARSLYRMSYVEYQAGGATEAQHYARQAAHLAQRIGAWFHFICAHSILYAVADGSHDDHAAALWHAQQIGYGAQRTGDRRHRLYALSAQYVLEVERGGLDRALAIEAEIPSYSSGFRDQPACYIALALRYSWDGAFTKAYRQLATLDDRLYDPAERRFWNGALALFAAFDGDERRASMHLRACGKHQTAIALENALANAQADCYAAVAQIVLGHPERAVRRLPHDGVTEQVRAISTCVRELAELGSSLGSATASRAIKRLAANGQEGFARALEVALASQRSDGSATPLTQAERRILAQMAHGTPAATIAHEHGRSLHTVRNQIKAVIRKLGASGSIEAVARAKRMGLLD
jgi:LuxR family transcriptional regulator, maltose regulon positive regulatory protein